MAYLASGEIGPRAVDAACGVIEGLSLALLNNIPDGPDAGHGVIDRTVGLARRLFGEGLRYFVASAAALVVDYAVLVGATELFRIHYLVSAALGFAGGLLVNYLLSVTWVFRERRLANRWAEAAGFAAVGLLGLALNEGLMALFVEGFGLAYAVAKIPATGIGFVFNYGVRRVLLFTRGPIMRDEPPAEQARAA
jgi:putative flippase GtrA